MDEQNSEMDYQLKNATGLGRIGGLVASAEGKTLQGPTMTTSSVSASVPQRESEVQREASIISAQTDNLLKLVGILEGRLNPILRPDTPEAKNAEGRPDPSTVIGQFIYQQANQVQRANRILSSMIERIEI